MIQLHKGDCIEIMKTLDDNSIDAVITDPPYGTTECKWDSVIPFDEMWGQLNRITKTKGVIALFGSEPFSSLLRMSNMRNFRYDWIWDKRRGSNFALANKHPIKTHEVISIFYKKGGAYMPIKTKGTPYDKTKYHGDWDHSNITGHNIRRTRIPNNGERFPVSIIRFSMDWRRQDQIHPTQKPVKIIEYFIKTYTNKGDVILDFTMGSGTTMIACKNLNRNGIGIELDDKYFNIAKKRIENHVVQLELFD